MHRAPPRPLPPLPPPARDFPADREEGIPPRKFVFYFSEEPSLSAEGEEEEAVSSSPSLLEEDSAAEGGILIRRREDQVVLHFRRHSPEPLPAFRPTPPPPTAPPVPVPEIPSPAADSWEQVQKEVEQVRHKALAERRKWMFDRELDSTLEQAGKKVGTVKTRVNLPAILQRVASRTLPVPGEIPFVVDSENRIYAPDPQRVRWLQSLGLTDFGEGPELVRKRRADYLVVTRTDPASGLTFGLARPVRESLRELRRTAGKNLAYGSAVLGLALLGVLPLSRRMTRNLQALTEGARRLARGDRKTPVPVRSRDELGELAEAFNRLASDLEAHERNLIRQERLQKEVEMCRQIQEELLPRSPLRLPFAEVKGVSLPAQEVGGDFFNYFPLPEDQVAIVVGDVSGKGVPAALLMANLQAKLQARLQVERDLSRLAAQLDEEIAGQTPPQTYLALFVAILDRALHLRWVNAGHHPQFALLSPGRVQRLNSTGRPPGLLPGGGYREENLQLNPGDSLFLYTDGLVEALDPQGVEFGSHRLEEILLEERGKGSDSLLEAVEEAVRRHRQGVEPEDDATLLFLRIGPASE